MATIGRLAVKIDADSSGLKAGLSDASKQTNMFGEQLQGLASKLKAIGPLAAIAGAAFATNMVRSIANTADELSKLSAKTGVAVEDLSRLQYAAGLSGVNNAALGSSLNRLARSMSDTAAGTGEAGKAFEAMGITVKNADGSLKAQKDVLQEVADKFASYKDGAEKSALAQQIFGRAGADLIPLLNGGAAGLKEMADESDRLGNTINDKTAKAAERFNDNLTRLQTAAGGMARTIAGPVIQSLADLTGSMVEAQKEGRGLLGILDAIIAGNVGKRSSIEDAAEDVKRLWKEYNRLEDLAAGQDVGTQAANNAEMAYSRYMDAMRNYGALMEKQIKTEEKLNEVRSAPVIQGATPSTGGKPAKSSGGGAAKPDTSAADEAMKKSQDVEAFFQKVQDDDAQRQSDRLLSFMDGLNARAEALRIGSMSEHAIAEEKYQKELEQLIAYKEQFAMTEEDYSARLLQIRMDRDESIMNADIAMLDHEKGIAEQRMALAQQVADHSERVQQNNTQRIIGLLSMLGNKNKAFALAAIALQTKTAFVQNKVATALAGNLAFASQIIPGDPTSLARATAAKAYALSQGAITGGLILASGAVQAAGAVSGGGGGGSSGGGSFSTGAGGGGALAGISNAAPGLSQTITIQGVSSGDLFGGDAVRTLIDKLIDAQRNGAKIVLA
jgi:hypothetical protein